MDVRLLLLEPDEPGGAGSLLDMLRDCAPGRCERVGWNSLALQGLDALRPNLIVAVSGHQTGALRRLFDCLRAKPSAAPTLAVLPPAPDDELLRLVDADADDVLFAPVRPAEMAHRVRRLLPTQTDVEKVVRSLVDKLSLAQLVGRSAAFTHVLAQLPRLARSAMPALITGETGTGKELCARAIHFLSNRRDCPFVAVDCAALPDHLVENELFGHMRGAYTDAHRDQRGLVEIAEGGTLFLDEIDALSPSAQGKLLRFLQERTFRPLGSERVRSADVNVIAATNRDLDAAVGAKQFRDDLFYRLNVLRLHLPPLRARRGDIGLLAVHFLSEQRTAIDGTPKAFSAASLRLLSAHDWPGNLRELHNVVQRAIVNCEGTQILPCHVALADSTAASHEVPAYFRTARAAAVAAFERRYVEDLLRKHGGNVTHAARDAHKERRVFGRLIKKHRIDRRAV